MPTLTNQRISPITHFISVISIAGTPLLRLATIILFSIICFPRSSIAEEESHSLKAEPHTGSYIPRAVVKNSFLPLDKKYEELSDAEKSYVRSAYENLPDTDEPPYPLHGLRPIFKQIYDIQQQVLVSGVISLDVMIDSTGKPQSVAVYKSPDKDVSTYVAVALMDARYKPGKCAGIPCKMAYRFDFNFVVAQ